MRVVGLTGGIGSGKTTVANFFKDLGIPVYIADEAGKKLMNTAVEVKEKISALFGENAYKQGVLDRKFISSQVFTDTEKLSALNSIVHPAVEKDFNIWKGNQQAAYVIYEAAILFETGSYKKCDLSILVVADYQTKISRLQKRDKSSLQEIEARMDQQWEDEKKRKMADFIIKNDKLSRTKEEVVNIHRIIS